MKQSTGVILHQSRYSVKVTIDRLSAFLKEHGATIYARIDQQAELKNAGLNIPPLEFILFGNPKAGGRIMKDNPAAALDLPLKLIAWEDDQQKVNIAYNEASYIEARHGLVHDPNSPLNLDALVEAVLR